MGLLAANGRADGSARFKGNEVIGLSDSEMNRVRGAEISMVFQDPMTSLNPYLTVGNQMRQVLQRHLGLSRAKALRQARRMLEMVRIPESERRLVMYPHELSGGMRQRVMIAMALSCRPGLLIADEPTTALDVTVQAQILELMRELKSEFNTSILLITHDMGVVAGNADSVLVMRDGVCREFGSVDNVFYKPADEYTAALLAAVPRLDEAMPERLVTVDAPATEPGTAMAAFEKPDANGPARELLRVDGLGVRFRVAQPGLFTRAQSLIAVDDVSFELAAGETLGVVGESGCGKSSLARGVLKLIPVACGRVCLLGRDLEQLQRKELKNMRSDMQVIFQDPQASLDPRMTISQIVGEPLSTFHPDLPQPERNERILSALLRVGLTAGHLNRYPHEFSGGQAQRIGIARALAFDPQLIVCDEPVSALDVSIQAQIINLLMDLQVERGLSLIFIAHDLAVVRHISHRVMVMYLGRAVELADRQSLYERPRHPYTLALINAVPIPDPEIERSRHQQPLSGDLPSPLEPPSGCAFRTRCPYAIQRCADERPLLRPVGKSLVACHRAEEIE
jgi:oligopeptide/dipeptide ABC transporter ATP-binding protein